MKIRKTLYILLAITLVLGNGTPVMAEGYRFNSEEYSYYYPPSDVEIQHDGHGNFTVEDTRSVITSGDGFVSVIKPDGGTNSTAQDSYPTYPDSWQNGPSGGGSYTEVAGIIQPGGVLGTLRFKGSTITVYEGTSNSCLQKGAGHFAGTSYWEGNVAAAGHNRGSSAYFGKLKNLNVGDTITYSTSLGTRIYQVYSSRQISVNDFSPLNGSNVNMLTLITCVENNPNMRLCVQAVGT